jgi:hypothetical protein
VLRGRQSAALTNWPSRNGALRAVLRISRDDTWYNSRPGDRALFVTDTITTVLAQIRRSARR